MSSFAIVDIPIAILLIYGAYKGYVYGFIYNLLRMSVLVVSIVFTALYYEQFYPLFTFKFLPSAELASQLQQVLTPIIVFIISYILISLLVRVLSFVLHSFTSNTSLGIANNILGAFLGLIKYGFVLTIIVYILFDNRIIQKVPGYQNSIFVNNFVTVGKSSVEYIRTKYTNLWNDINRSKKQ